MISRTPSRERCQELSGRRLGYNYRARAVIGGAEGWEEIEDFAEDRKEWFATFLDMPNGVPSESTFYRTFQSLNAKAFGADQ